METLIKKLFIIVMGIYLVICAGSIFIYPVYLHKMVETQHFSLREVNFFGSLITIGFWISIPVGAFFDKCGPKISLGVGLTLISGSYIALHFILNAAAPVSIYVFLLIAFLMGQGGAICYTVGLSTNLINFKFKESGVIVGLLVASEALSPSLFTTYRETFQSIEIQNFFIIIAVFNAIIILICIIIFGVIKNPYSDCEHQAGYEQHKEKYIVKAFLVINFISLMIYIVGIIVNNDSQTDKFPNYIIYPCIQLLNFLIILLEYFKVFDKILYPDYIESELRRKMEDEVSNSNKKGMLADNQTESQTVSNENASKEIQLNTITTKDIQKMDMDNANIKQIEHKDEIEIVDNHDRDNEIDNKRKSLDDTQDIQIKDNTPDKNVDVSSISHHSNEELNPNTASIASPEQELVVVSPPARQLTNFLDTFKNPRIYILFVILILGIGTTISNISNIGFIIKSITTEYAHTEIFEYVILYFSFNSFIRVIGGIALDNLFLEERQGYFLIFTAVLGLISQLFGIPMEKKLFGITISLAGATHGCLMTFTPLFVKTTFGLDHYGKIIGVLTTGNAIGVFLMSNFVFIAFYEGNVNPELGRCFGKICFYPSFIITSIFMLIILGLSILFIRLKK